MMGLPSLSMGAPMKRNEFAEEGGAPFVPDGDALDFGSRQDFLKMLKEYLDDGVPPEYLVLTQKFFGVASKSMKLGFLERKEVDGFELGFEISKINFIMSKPEHKFSFDDQQFLEQLHLIFRMNLFRSVGTTKQIINERMAEVSQVVQSISASSQSVGGGKKRGIFNLGGLI